MKGIVAAAGGLGVPWKWLLRVSCVARLFAPGFMVESCFSGFCFSYKRAWQINKYGCCDCRRSGRSDPTSS